MLANAREFIDSRWTAKRIRQHDRERPHGASGLEARAVCLLLVTHGNRAGCALMRCSLDRLRGWIYRDSPEPDLRERLATLIRRGALS